MSPDGRLAVRALEAAKMLGISERTLWKLTKNKQIPCKRVGDGCRKTTLYSIRELDAWLAAEHGGGGQQVNKQ